MELEEGMLLVLRCSKYDYNKAPLFCLVLLSYLKRLISQYLCRYEGRWENGIKNGKGMVVFPSGEKFAGEFLNNLKHGKGRSTTAAGDVVEGMAFIVANQTLPYPICILLLQCCGDLTSLFFR